MFSFLLEPAYYVSVFFFMLTLIISVAFVVPLQIKEASVHNGLVALRRLLLIKGILFITISLSSVIALLAERLTPLPVAVPVIVVVVLINSLGNFGKAWIDYRVYHQQYSPENKKLHEKMGGELSE